MLSYFWDRDGTFDALHGDIAAIADAGGDIEAAKVIFL